MARWTAADDAYLREHFLTSSHAAIGAVLKRPEKGVRNRCWRLRLRKLGPGWTNKQDAQLRLWYAERQGRPLDLDGASALIGRSWSDVSERAAEFGLSDRTRPRPDNAHRLRAGESGWAAGKGGHPRGMLGKTHTPEARRRLSLKSQERVAAGTHVLQRPRTQEWRDRQSRSVSAILRAGGNVYSRCKRGKRADLDGQFFRSSWEANYARFLNLLVAQGQIASWKFEPDTFWFEKVRRGVRSYTPDFRIEEASGAIYYVEVKGWLDAKSKTKLKRMKKYHPAVDLRLVDQKAYEEISRKLGGAIPNWERVA